MHQPKILVVPGGNEKYKSKSKCKYNNKLKNSNFSKDKMQPMDAFFNQGSFSLNHSTNCQAVVFSLMKIHSSLLICNQFCLECSGEWFFYHQLREV